MRSLLTGLLLYLPLLSWSQIPVQVVTKIIEKSMPYVTGQPIQISAQKADITRDGIDQRFRLSLDYNLKIRIDPLPNRRLITTSTR